MKLGETSDADKGMNPLHFWSDPAYIWIRIWITPNPSTLFLEFSRVGGGMFYLGAI